VGVIDSAKNFKSAEIIRCKLGTGEAVSTHARPLSLSPSDGGYSVIHLCEHPGCEHRELMRCGLGFRHSTRPDACVPLPRKLLVAQMRSSSGTGFSISGKNRVGR